MLQDEETGIEHSQPISKRRPLTQYKATPSQEAHIIMVKTTTGTTITKIEKATTAAEAMAKAGDRTEEATAVINSEMDNTNQVAGIMVEVVTTITKRETMCNIKKRGIKSNRDRSEEIDSITITTITEITDRITIDITIITTGEKVTTITEVITEIITKNPTEIVNNTKIGSITIRTTRKRASKKWSPLSQRLKLRSS